MILIFINLSKNYLVYFELFLKLILKQTKDIIYVKSNIFINNFLLRKCFKTKNT